MYTTEDVKKVQHRLLEMAIVIRDILEKNDIPYFITYGTLLGAVRHKGFIPWDDDFDFYLFDDTYEKALNVLQQELPSYFFLEYWKTEPKYYHGWAHVKDVNSIAECELYPDDSKYIHKGISIDLYKTKKICEKEEQFFRLSEHIAYLKRKNSAGLLDDNFYKEKVKDLSDQLSVEEKRLSEMINRGPEMYAFFIFYNDRLFVDEVFPLKDYQFEGTRFLGPAKPEALLTRCYGDFMKLPPIDKRIPHYSSVRFL